MNTEQIMALADAYASQLQVCNFADADKARDALQQRINELEAAIVNQQLTVEQEPVAWGTEVKYGKLFFRIGVQSFAIDYTPEDEPDCSAGNAMAWMEKRLHEALSNLAGSHPAPVNQQLLERISELEALNERLWVALKGYHSNSAKQDWPEDIWIAAEVALREAAIAQAEGK